MSIRETETPHASSRRGTVRDRRQGGKRPEAGCRLRALGLAAVMADSGQVHGTKSVCRHRNQRRTRQTDTRSRADYQILNVTTSGNAPESAISTAMSNTILYGLWSLEIRSDLVRWEHASRLSALDLSANVVFPKCFFIGIPNSIRCRTRFRQTRLLLQMRR